MDYFYAEIMYYFYTILIPLIILILRYFLSENKPKKFSDYIDFIFKSLCYLFLYAFITYYLEMEDYDIYMFWVFPALLFYLIPISIITFLIKVFLWIKSYRKLK